MKSRKLILASASPQRRKEIDDYIKTGEPFSAAGAYAIQKKGKEFVAAVRGNIDTVISLPIAVLKRALAHFL